MIPFQADPTDLEPIGGSLVGILVPALVLVASIVVSFVLYWYFSRRQPRGGT